MSKGTMGRLVLILAVVGFCAWSALPLEKKINLGLDLQGGMHLVYEVDAGKAVLSTLDSTADDLAKFLKEQGVIVAAARRDGEGVRLVLSGSSQIEAARQVIADEYTVIEEESSDESAGLLRYRFTDDYRTQVFENAIDQALETLRNRIDQFGVAEPVIQREGGNRILIQLPGVQDRERAIRIIGKTARLEFRLLNHDLTAEEAMARGVPADSEILHERQLDPVTRKPIGKVPYLVKRKVELTGGMVADAKVAVSQMNLPYVSLTLNKEGARLFADVTGRNVNRRLAIILDGSVYSAPNINERIGGGSAMITGSFTYDEARDLALVLRAGALPAPLVKLEERSVGPSLGADSISRGVESVIVGGLIVIIFMLVYYRLGGVVADVALLLNMVILGGALASFGATLTLPGIAGIILTIGMAVDANVLVFERIREELRVGKTPRAAVDTGFEKAFLTIVDANVTTLIAAVVLFQFGTGPVKGFAVTLSLGILASMFTALFVSRTIFNWYLGNRRVNKLSI